MIAKFLDWMIAGTDEQTLPPEWLADWRRLKEYDRWTRRQRFQGSIVADTAEMQRRQFWAAQEAKRQTWRQTARVLRKGER